MTWRIQGCLTHYTSENDAPEMYAIPLFSSPICVKLSAKTVESWFHDVFPYKYCQNHLSCAEVSKCLKVHRAKRRQKNKVNHEKHIEFYISLNEINDISC